MKKRHILFLAILLIPYIVDASVFVLTNGIDVLYTFSLAEYLLAFIQTMKESLGFYSTYVPGVWAVEKYFQQQKERNFEIAQKDKENNEIKREELEQYRDSFRPSFVLNEVGDKLILLMRRNDLYIENVYYYKSGDVEGTHYKNVKHNREIDLEGSKNNYFVTAETLIGEKIIFGVILNSVRVYKALIDGYHPIVPSEFYREDLSNRIDERWKSFNRYRFDNNCFKEIDKEIDIHFMYKTVGIRQKMITDLDACIAGIIAQDTVKKIFCCALGCISGYKSVLQDSVRVDIIMELEKILRDNIDMITINPFQILNDEWEYIIKKTKVSNSFTENRDFAALYIIQQYLQSSISIDNQISAFLKLIENADFSDQLESKIPDYKARILKHIEQ